MTSINTEEAVKTAKGMPASSKLQQPQKEENGESRAAISVATSGNRSERFWPTAASTLVASIPALLIGYTVAFPSSALLVLMDGWREGCLPGKDYQFSTELSDMFGALAPLGAIIGGPVGGWIADCWGRKCSMMFCGVPYLMGYLLLSYAHFTSTPTAFKTVLLTGRFLSGLGMGWASSTSSIYIGEIASSKLRGLFGTVMQLYLSLGILLCFAMSTSLPYYHVALGAAVAVTLFVVLAFWLRETPRWLLANGHAHSAFESLKWFRGPNYDLYRELNTMKLSLSDDNRTGVWKEFRKKYVLVPLVMLLLVFFFQQIGGLNAMGAYGTIIFKDAGVNHPQLASALTMGVSDIVGNVVAGVIVDRMGRKPLLVISGIGMGVGSSLLGIHFYLTRPSQCSSNGVADLLGAESLGATQCNAQYRPLAIVSIIIYNLMFSVGWGPVPWILLPELLPLRVRGIGGGFSILVNWATSALVAGAYLSYSETVTLWFAWWSFALLNFTSIVFVLVALVETRGENLEVIQTAFKKR